MADPRTDEQVLEDYNLARAAWHRALEAQSYSRSDNVNQISLLRAAVKDTHDQMLYHASEIAARDRGGISVRAMTPRDD